MKTKWIALLTLVSLTQAPELLAQEADLAFVSPGVASIQPVPGEKSGFLAGALSGLVFPGLGSFYAGNNGHGTRHVVIAAVAIGGLAAGGGDCFVLGSLGLNDPDEDCTLTNIAAGVYLANWVWAIVVGVNDASDYNRALNTAGVQVAPQFVAIRSGGQGTTGLQLLRLGL